MILTEVLKVNVGSNDLFIDGYVDYIK